MFCGEPWGFDVDNRRRDVVHEAMVAPAMATRAIVVWRACAERVVRGGA